MRPDTLHSHVPIEARLRNARRLLTTVPPVAILAAAAVAVSVWSAPEPTEVAGKGAAAVLVSVPAAAGEPTEPGPAESHADETSGQQGAHSTAGATRQARIAR